MEVDVRLLERSGVPSVRLDFSFKFPIEKEEVPRYALLTGRTYDPGDMVPLNFSLEYSFGSAFPKRQLMFIEQKCPDILQVCSATLGLYAQEKERSALEVLLLNECMTKLDAIVYSLM